MKTINELKKNYRTINDNVFSNPIRQIFDNEEFIALVGNKDEYPTELEGKSIVYFMNSDPSMSYNIDITSDEKANNFIDDLLSNYADDEEFYMDYATGAISFDEEIIKYLRGRFDILCDMRWGC